MTIPPVMDDIAAMLDFIDRQDEVKRGPARCHGYCMSGPLPWLRQRAIRIAFAAAASFYGTWLVSDAEETRICH